LILILAASGPVPPQSAPAAKKILAFDNLVRRFHIRENNTVQIMDNLLDQTFEAEAPAVSPMVDTSASRESWINVSNQMRRLPSSWLLRRGGMN
jgi:hypothetical protein